MVTALEHIGAEIYMLYFFAIKVSSAPATEKIPRYALPIMSVKKLWQRLH